MSEANLQRDYRPSQDMHATVIPSARTRAGSDTDGRSLGFDPAATPTRVLIDPGHPDGMEINLASLVKDPERYNKLAKQSDPQQNVTGFFESLKQEPELLPPVLVDPDEIQKLLELEHKSAHVTRNIMRTASDAILAQPVESDPTPSLVSLAISLEIPFLKPQPVKPDYKVYFDLGNMGTLSANYHEVIEGKDCLCLVYDTRFEYGTQYLPPALVQKFKITIPKIGKTPFICSSHGLHWDMGKLTFVLLLTHEEL